MYTTYVTIHTFCKIILIVSFICKFTDAFEQLLCGLNTCDVSARIFVYTYTVSVQLTLNTRASAVESAN